MSNMFVNFSASLMTAGMMAAGSFALAASVPATTQQAATQSVHVTGIRREEAFRLPGSNGVGLVVSVRVDQVTPQTSSDDFVLVLLDSEPRRTGQAACLAVRVLDGSDPKRWVLLDGPTGTLARSYRPLIDSNAAIVHTGRKLAFEKPGRYELVYLVGTDQEQAALAYVLDAVHRPVDAKRSLIETFKVPAR
jgi:hypothetical protein